MPEPVRRRRTAEEARHRILEAAQKRLVEEGPDRLRLQELAADLGISHPAILHHFGSREGLLSALAAHGVEGLNAEIAERIGTGAVDLREILALTSETLASRGQARLLAWLALSGRAPDDAPPEGRALVPLAELSHAARTARRRARGQAPAPYEDTVFSILLVGLALFGDALVGDLFRRSIGLDEADAAERFRGWLADLLEAHYQGPDETP